MNEIDKHLKALKGENSEKIKEAVNFLSIQKDNLLVLDRLYEILEDYLGCEDCSSLWAAVILGELEDKGSVKRLLSILDSDEDYLVEASLEALIRIENAWPQSVVPHVFDFIEDRLFYDPGFSKYSAYEILEAFIDREEVRRFLILMFEEDVESQDFISGILAKTGDKGILELLKIGLALSEVAGDKYDYNDMKWSYFYLDKGRDFPSGDLWKKKWSDRWGSLLEDLGFSEKEREAKHRNIMTELKKHCSSPKEKKEQEEFEALDIPPFNMEKYLKIREWTEPLHEFHKVLVLLGFADEYSMETIQLMINQAKEPSQVLSRLLGNYMFRSREAMEIFSNAFSYLWNSTPREELNGLNPDQALFFGVKRDIKRS